MKLSGRTPHIPLSAAIEWRLLSLARSRDGRDTKIGHEPITNRTSRLQHPSVEVLDDDVPSVE